MSKVLLVICVTLSLSAAAFAQTAAELSSKYAHHEVYEVQPGIQMTANFATDGLVCQMQIEQTHFKKDEVDLRDGIEKEHVDDLLDQLVPPSERGDKDDDPANNLILGLGQGFDETRSYSNITVDLFSSHGTTVVTVKWRHRTCEQ